MKSFMIMIGLSMLLSVWHAREVSANFWDWDDREYHIDTEVIAANPQTGELFLANRMILDRRIEQFVFVHPVGVGDRVRLVFDDTNYLRRVYRLP
ncbi:MAG: hypothetical protein ACE360_09770 [Hyphomicrobiales bacterium]